MTQDELDREIAKATGEPVTTITEIGFVPLTKGPVELDCDRDPLVVDWHDLERGRSRRFLM